MICGGPCGLPLASNACMVSRAAGEADDVASTVNRCLLVLYSTRLIASTSDATGFTVMVTVAGADETPLLLVTINWKVSTAAAPGATTGAVNVGAAVFAPASTTVVPPVCVQANVRISPLGSLLAAPFNVTTEPDGTD